MLGLKIINAKRLALVERDELIGGSVEEREYGSVPLRIYLIYAKACGHALSGSYLLFAIGYEVVRVLTSFWLSRWSDSVAQVSEEPFIN